MIVIDTMKSVKLFSIFIFSFLVIGLFSGMVNGVEINLTRLANASVLPGYYPEDLKFLNQSNGTGYLLLANSISAPYFRMYKQSGNTITNVTWANTYPTGTGRGIGFVEQSNGTVYVCIGHSTSPYISIYKKAGDKLYKLSNPATLPEGDVNDCSFLKENNGTIYLIVGHSGSPYMSYYKKSGDTFTELSFTSYMTYTTYTPRFSNKVNKTIVYTMDTRDLQVYYKTHTSDALHYSNSMTIGTSSTGLDVVYQNETTDYIFPSTDSTSSHCTFLEYNHVSNTFTCKNHSSTQRIGATSAKRINSTTTYISRAYTTGSGVLQKVVNGKLYNLSTTIFNYPPASSFYYATTWMSKVNDYLRLAFGGNTPDTLTTYRSNIYIGTSVASNATITAKSTYNSSSINSFSVRIQNGSTIRTQYTSTGTITTRINSTYANRYKYNITFFNISNHLSRTYSNYNFSANSNTLIGNISPILVKENIIKIFNNQSYYLNSENYSTVLYGSFNLSESNSIYVSTLLNTYTLDSGFFKCKILIDSIDYDSERRFRSTSDSLFNIPFLSKSQQISSGVHTYDLRCKKDSSSTPDILINQISSQIHVAYNYTVFNFTYRKSNINISSSSYSLLDSGTILTSNYTINSPKTRAIILEGIINSTFTNSMDLEIKVSINNSNISYYKMNASESTDSFKIHAIKINIGSNQNVPIKIYGKRIGSGSADIDMTWIAKESIELSNQINFTNSISNILNTTGYKNISSRNIRVNITGDDIFVSGHIIVNSSVSNDIGLKLKLGSEEVIFYKTIPEDNFKIINFEYIFKGQSTGSKTIYLQAFAYNKNTTVYNGTMNLYVATDKSFNENSFALRVKDNYTQSTIYNFSVWLGKNELSTTNGMINIPAYSTYMNFTVGSDIYGGFINRTFVNQISTSDLNTTLYQSIITINFQHVISLETIPGLITVNNTNYSIKLNKLSGATYYFRSGLNRLKLNKTGYSTRFANITVSPREVSSYTIYLYPILNVTIYDEKTVLPFNVSGLDLIQMQLICQDNTTIVQNILTNNPTLNITCPYQKIKFYVYYPGDSYYRTYPYTSAVIGVSNNNFRVWLLNLNTTDVIFNTFQTYDLFKEYQNVKILIYKIIGTTSYLITGDAIDIEGKIGAYLIRNNEYVVKILSSNKPEKDMGSYYSDISGQSAIRLFELSLTPESTSYFDQVTAYSYLVNETGNLIIRAAVNDTGDNIVNSTLTVRQNSRSGAIICQFSSVSKNVEYSCDVPDIATNTYYASIDVTTTGDTTEHLFEKLMKGSELIPMPMTFANPETMQWILFLVLLTVGFTLTITTSAVGGLFIVALAAFLKVIGWIRLANVSLTDTALNLKIAGLVVSLLIFLAIAHILKKGQRER